MRFGLNLPSDFGAEPRFADPGLARDQHDPPLAAFRLPPTALQQLQFLVAANERRRA